MSLFKTYVIDGPRGKLRVPIYINPVTPRDIAHPRALLVGKDLYMWNGQYLLHSDMVYYYGKFLGRGAQIYIYVDLKHKTLTVTKPDEKMCTQTDLLKVQSNKHVRLLWPNFTLQRRRD